jgi:nitroimidazol reductase NimA-like FMN-containing flavoprotein (pyridoxamine 5'-phosphate oxidase superfamily)
MVMSLAMSKDQREEFLSGLHVGIVGIQREGKGPLTVPIWYDYEPGGELWMITQNTSIKGKLLAVCERISLCVQTEVAPYQYVSIEGPFSTSESTNEQLLSMAVRYLGEEQGKAYADGSGDGEGSIVVRIKPETWYTVDYSKR